MFFGTVVRLQHPLLLCGFDVELFAATCKSIYYSLLWNLSFSNVFFSVVIKTVMHFTPSGVAQLVKFFSKLQDTVYHGLCGIL